MSSLLSLASQESLPIESRLLGEQALRCRAYAKALHYKEEEFHKGATTQVIETLISVNNKLQQKEAAQGELTAGSRETWRAAPLLYGRKYRRFSKSNFVQIEMKFQNM